MSSDDGTLEIRDGVKVLRYERRLRHPVDRVWRALTEPDELRGWLAEADLDPRAGGEVELRWLNTDEEGSRAVARGTVARWEPPRVVELDTDIHGRLRWELEPDGDGATRLTFTVEHATLPDEYVTKVRAGWHIHLEHLEAALNGHRVDWDRWDEEHLPRWKEIEARYAAEQTTPT
jgi:uncharacterized protein YndB with AHSA1/START domain